MNYFMILCTHRFRVTHRGISKLASHAFRKLTIINFTQPMSCIFFSFTIVPLNMLSFVTDKFSTHHNDVTRAISSIKSLTTCLNVVIEHIVQANDGENKQKHQQQFSSRRWIHTWTFPQSTIKRFHVMKPSSMEIKTCWYRTLNESNDYHATQTSRMWFDRMLLLRWSETRWDKYIIKIAGDT